MAEFGKGAELLELASVRSAIDQAAEYATSVFGRRLHHGLEYVVASHSRSLGETPIESPIEAIFAVWFYAAMSLEDEGIYDLNLLRQQVVTSGDKTYRFDFTVHFGATGKYITASRLGVPQPKVAIELDGHEFHSTKDQLIVRNARDRDLQADGWIVFHFSGSELYLNPLKCVEEVITFSKWRHVEFETAVDKAATAAQQAG